MAVILYLGGKEETERERECERKRQEESDRILQERSGKGTSKDRTSKKT